MTPTPFSRNKIRRFIKWFSASQQYFEIRFIPNLTQPSKRNYNVVVIIYNLFIALIVVVLASFIAVPALRRLIRNIHLVRKGNVTTGYYSTSNKVVFLVESKEQITFTTWHSSFGTSKELEVLYNPDQPEKAEVRSTRMLWVKPADTLVLSVGLLIIASLLVLGVNYGLVLCLFVACVIFLGLLTRVVLAFLVLLSFKYKAFGRVGTYVMAGFTPRSVRKRPSGK
jgi:hypothetical protein